MAIQLNLNGVKSNEFEEGKTSSVLDTGLYQGLLKYVYLTEAKTGTVIANAVIEINGMSKTFPMYITYKENKSPVKTVNGKPQTIPGYKQLNSLLYCACGKTFDQCTQEDKSIAIYDWDQKKEVPTMVPCIIDSMNTKIGVGIKKINKHKQAKVNNIYVPTTETYLTNEVDRYYTVDGYLASEKASGSEPKYAVSWKEKAGTVFEEKLKVTPIAPPTANLASQPAGTSGTPVKDLFADD